MGLRGSLSSIVQSAMKTVGDIAETVTYVSITEGAYNAATGTPARSENQYSLKAVIGSFGAAGLGTEKNLVKEGHSSDLSALFASADLPVTPNTGDEIISSTERYKVKQITRDPAGASYRLIVERMG